jgi:hypothetical protein
MSSNVQPQFTLRWILRNSAKLLRRYLAFWWSTCSWRASIAVLPDIALVVAYTAAYTDGTEVFGLSGQ